MELIFKISAAAIISAVLGLLIKKLSPELSLGLSVCVIAMIFSASLGFVRPLRELADTVKTLTGGAGVYMLPVLKCLAVAIVTRISSELCRDSSQAAAAAALDFAGTLCAMGVAAPMILSMLKMVASLV